MRQVATFELPWPPTVNSLFATAFHRGRTMSARGRAFVSAVNDLAWQGKIPRMHLKGRLGIVITAFPPDMRLRDLDNLFKAPLDALTKCGAIEDDSCFEEMHIYRGKVAHPGRLEVTLYVGD